MFYIKLIKYFYLFLTVLAILSPVNLSLSELTPAIIFLWLTFFMFNYKLTAHQLKYPIFNSEVNVSTLNNKGVFLITLSFIIFIPLYIKFYTGSSLTESLIRFVAQDVGADSAYAMYQEYFAESDLGQMSLQKIPYILGNGILRFLFWTTAISIIGYRKTIPIFQIINLFLIFILYFILGISRGTGFEAFELLFILIFCMLLRFNVLHKSPWLKGKSKLFIYITALLGLTFFIINISLRYSGEIVAADVSSTLRFDENSFVSKNIPWLAPILMNMSGYFLFGIYFITSTINNIWLDGTLRGFMTGLTPLGIKIFNYGESYRQILCDSMIDCGFAWVPDAMNIIGNTGLIVFLIIIVIVGKYSYICFRKALMGSPWHAIVLFVITYEMFSLPVGNFIMSSSGNIIAVVLVVMFKYLKVERFLWKRVEIK